MFSEFKVTMRRFTTVKVEGKRQRVQRPLTAREYEILRLRIANTRQAIFKNCMSQAKAIHKNHGGLDTAWGRVKCADMAIRSTYPIPFRFKI